MKKTLFVFLTLMLLCLSVFSADTNCNVYYNLANFSLSPVANSRVTVTPLWPLGSYNGQILSPTSVAQNTDANGLTTFSNIVSGYAYRVQLYPSGTTFTNVITVGVTGTVNGHDYIGNFAGQFFQYYYTSNLLAASFDPLGAAQQATNTIAAPAIVGLVTSNQIATINPSQIYPAVSVSGGQTNWAVSAITNAGIIYNGTTYAFVTNNNGGALTNISGSSVSGASTITNGLATVSYVGSTSNALFNLIPYGTSDIYFSSQTNNFYIAGVTNLSTMIDAPPLLTSTNTISSWVNGTYFMNRIQTNYIRYISSATMDLYTYILISGGGAAAVTAHPEIWLYNTNNGGTTVRIGSAADVAYSNTIETPTSIAIPLTNTAYLNTALTNGTQILLRWYVTLTAGSPTWRFYIGGSYGSHLTVGGIIGKSLYNATLNSDQTFSGANAFTNTGNTFLGLFTGNGAGLTNLSLPYTSITNSPWITTNAFTSLISSSNFVTASVTNGLTTATNNFYGTFTGNGAGLTNLSLPYISITNSPWITTNAFTSLISSSNFVKSTVTNGLTGNSNNFYGTFGTIIQPVYLTTNSLVVSGITNYPGITEALSHYNGTYYWSNGVGSQGFWVKGSTNFFGYDVNGFSGPCFTTNVSDGSASFIGDYNATWTPFSGSLFSSSVGIKTFTFQNSGGSPDIETATFTLPVSTAAATNLFTPTAISLMAASGNTNLLISNNDPWFTTDKNPTLDVSGSVDQALVVKGSFYVTGTLNGNGGGLTNLPSSTPSGVLTNNYTANIVVTNAGVATIIQSNLVNATSYLLPAISNNVVPSAKGYSLSTANINTNIIILSGAGISTANGNYYWSSLTNGWTNNTSSPFTIVISTNTLTTNAFAAISNTVYTTSRSTNLATYVGPRSGVGLWANGLNPSYTNLSTVPVSSWNYTNGGLMNITMSPDGTNQFTPMTLSSNGVTVNYLKILTSTNDNNGMLFQYGIAIGGNNVNAGFGFSDNNSICIGNGAGNMQNVNSLSTVCIGYNAGKSGQWINAVNIGNNAGQGSVGYGGGDDFASVAIGDGAGKAANMYDTVCIGKSAGINSADERHSVIIGDNANGNALKATGAVILGYYAGYFSVNTNNLDSIIIGSLCSAPTNNSINIGNTIYGNRTTASVMIPGTISATNGFILPQLSAIPTNSIPAPSSTTTNWVLLNLTGNAYLVATNTTSGGWLYQKLTSSITTTP